MLCEGLFVYLCLVYALGRALYNVLNKKIRWFGFLECLFMAEPARNQVRSFHWRCEREWRWERTLVSHWFRQWR